MSAKRVVLGILALCVAFGVYGDGAPNVTTHPGSFPQSTTWNDSQSPALAARVGGTAPAFAAKLGTMYGYQFGANEEVHADIQFSHAYLTGTPWRPHVHFLFPSAPTAGETVIWSIELSVASVNTMFPAASTIVCSTYTATAEDASQARPYHRVVSCPEQAGTGVSESAWVMVRPHRSGGTSSVEPILGFVDIHYQQSKAGTLEEYPR